MTPAAARAVRAVLPTLGRTTTTNRHSVARLSQRRARRVMIRPAILGYPLELAPTPVDLVRFWPGGWAAALGVPGPTRAACPIKPRGISLWVRRRVVRRRCPIETQPWVSIPTW